MATIIDLNGTWEFKAVDAYGTLPAAYGRAAKWMPATVPGTVHTDLMANQVIPDPYFRTNELDVQWVDKVQWMYRHIFVVPGPLLRESTVRLRAEGLDTYAAIRVNGTVVGCSANMFVAHEFNIKKVLREGPNTIEILFDSPEARSRALQQKHGGLRVALESHRVYVRKAQYSFGWDWGPKLTTSGIWRPIAIEAFTGARVRDPFIRVVSLNGREAVIRIETDIDGRLRPGTRVHVALEGSDAGPERSALVRGRHCALTFRVPRPHLWWPNGLGDQPLSVARLTLLHEDREPHEVSVRFALRTVHLLQEPDAEGRSFVLEVNGRKVFCKGADWIPADNFLPRIPPSRYQTLLGLARDAHMNMIRVWGGGIYEDDVFYEQCDRLGLMVWHDFMFACGEYPEEHWFLKDVRTEAEKAVKRLRNHPSIVLWCGNNECEWLFCMENPGKKPDDMKGAKIFRDLLPSVCQEFDGTRPYWRSSPFGGGFPNDESNGNHHQWSVWSAWKDYSEYRKDNARFVTEFGFQAPANLKTMEECTDPGDRHPQHRVVEHHNKQVEGTERLIRFMSGHFRVSMEYPRFIYLGQLVQGEALRCAVEHWRRRQFRTAGALFWQLNDCWPVSSWAVVDSALRPKAAYYFAKRFFASVLVSFTQMRGRVEVWVTNDRHERVVGELTVTRLAFEGRASWETKTRIQSAGGSSRCLMRLDALTTGSQEPVGEYLRAAFVVEGEVIAENRHYFDEPKHLLLPEPGLSTSVREEDRGRFVLDVKAERLARFVKVWIEGEDVIFDDNFFDIDAGKTRDIRFSSSSTISDLKNRIRLERL